MKNQAAVWNGHLVGNVVQDYQLANKKNSDFWIFDLGYWLIFC